MASISVKKKNPRMQNPNPRTRTSFIFFNLCGDDLVDGSFGIALVCCSSWFCPCVIFFLVVTMSSVARKRKRASGVSSATNSSRKKPFLTRPLTKKKAKAKGLQKDEQETLGGRAAEKSGVQWCANKDQAKWLTASFHSALGTALSPLELDPITGLSRSISPPIPAQIGKFSFMFSIFLLQWWSHNPSWQVDDAEGL